MTATPMESAAALLMDCDGDQRSAEASAWKLRESYRPGEAGYDYWLKVALAIVEGKELPKVERTTEPVAGVTFKRIEVQE